MVTVEILLYCLFNVKRRTGQAADDIKIKSRVRFAHFATGTAALDFFVDGTLIAAAVEYKRTSDYIAIDVDYSGSRLEVRIHGASSNSVLTAPLHKHTFMTSSQYTIAISHGILGRNLKVSRNAIQSTRPTPTIRFSDDFERHGVSVFTTRVGAIRSSGTKRRCDQRVVHGWRRSV
jgi:hypothetical protein